MGRTEGSNKTDNREIAQMVVLNRLGLSAVAIGKRLGRSNHTVQKYLDAPISQSPEVKILIELITQKEIEDLRLLGAKARNRLHELIDEGKTKMIETCAVMDRSFQQRLLLQEKSAANIAPEKLIFNVVQHIDNRQVTVNTPDRHNDKEILQKEK